MTAAMCPTCRGALFYGRCDVHGKPAGQRDYPAQVCPTCGGTGECAACTPPVACHSCDGNTLAPGTGRSVQPSWPRATALERRSVAAAARQMVSPVQRELDGAEALHLIEQRR